MEFAHREIDLRIRMGNYTFSSAYTSTLQRLMPMKLDYSIDESIRSKQYIFDSPQIHDDAVHVDSSTKQEKKIMRKVPLLKIGFHISACGSSNRFGSQDLRAVCLATAISVDPLFGMNLFLETDSLR